MQGCAALELPAHANTSRLIAGVFYVHVGVALRARWRRARWRRAPSPARAAAWPASTHPQRLELVDLVVLEDKVELGVEPVR